MQTLQFILTIVSILAYLATSYMAIMAFFYLRHLKKNKEVLREVLKRLLMLSIANEVRENMRDVNEMKIDFQRLIENEQFERALALAKYGDYSLLGSFTDNAENLRQKVNVTIQKGAEEAYAYGGYGALVRYLDKQMGYGQLNEESKAQILRVLTGGGR